MHVLRSTCGLPDEGRAAEGACAACLWVGISLRIKGVTDALFLGHWNLRNFNSEIKDKDGVDATGMHLLYPYVCLGSCNFIS